MTVPRLVAACLAGSVLVASAHAQGLSASDVKARDFSFQGIPFGCSIEQFKTKYPDAELLPDPAGKGKTLTTAADRRLNAVRYCVEQKRDREGVPSSHFRKREYLFVDDKMVEFCGLDFFRMPTHRSGTWRCSSRRSEILPKGCWARTSTA